MSALMVPIVIAPKHLAAVEGFGSVGAGRSRALRGRGAARQLGLFDGRGDASGRTPAYPTQLMN